MIKHALSVTRADDFAQWYQTVISEADMAEESGVRGCMVIRPWGYGIWERMQRLLDDKIKATGHENCYFPLFIPLSNWTELDIWQYIYLENIDIVPLYFAAMRPVVDRGGIKIMVDDERMPIGPEDEVKQELVRFRTLGCYPLTGAIESNATTLPEIIEEMLITTSSERQGRLIDHDQAGSMEQKKRQGYF